MIYVSVLGICVTLIHRMMQTFVLLITKKITKMKNAIIYMLTAILLFAFIPVQLKADAVTIPPSTKMVESIEANALLARLVEIKEMDKSKLTSSEKSVLRKEVRQTKQKLNHIGGGVYLSVGAIIIILLLLIILL